MVSLTSLPHDLVFLIVSYLHPHDVCALQQTSKHVWSLTSTRTVYLSLAHDLLRRCRPLPLKGFTRILDLDDNQLRLAVHKAANWETAWRTRCPRPIPAQSTYGVESRYSNYMDDYIPVPEWERTVIFGLTGGVGAEQRRDWYRVLPSVPGEEVDWLSPVTSNYLLSSTKSGKVIVSSATAHFQTIWEHRFAEWQPPDGGLPGGNWELWKCRVEFDDRSVYFCMARTLHTRNDADLEENKPMEFLIVRLTFPPSPTSEGVNAEFETLSSFKTRGIVLSVFLLDPRRRLICALVYVHASKNIALYALPDWNEDRYVFVDTGIECTMSANWSCILSKWPGKPGDDLSVSDPATTTTNGREEDDKEKFGSLCLVVHSEDNATSRAAQHFYPFVFLTKYASSSSSVGSGEKVPTFSRRSADREGMGRRLSGTGETSVGGDKDDVPLLGAAGKVVSAPIVLRGRFKYPSAEDVRDGEDASEASENGDAKENANPYPFRPWFPDSAHFVRQWWPAFSSYAPSPSSPTHTSDCYLSGSGWTEARDPSVTNPRVSCSVVLLANHDEERNRMKFVLGQWYFRCPLFDPCSSVRSDEAPEQGEGEEQREVAKEVDGPFLEPWYSPMFEVVCVFDDPPGEAPNPNAQGNGDAGNAGGNRPRPLLAVDFGCAAWIEYVLNPDGDGGEERRMEVERQRTAAKAWQDEVTGSGSGGIAINVVSDDDGADAETPVHPERGWIRTEEEERRLEEQAMNMKWLRFVSFPAYDPGSVLPSASSSSSGKGKTRQREGSKIHTLPIPKELDLDLVETINIDESQGAVIVSARDEDWESRGGAAKVFVLCYE